jgi:CheY-like chemotaxis protein
MATKGMYSLPQAGLIANKLLEKRLNKHGYRQSKLVPGLWKHDTRPIQFILVVDDSPTEVFVIRKALEKHGYQTASAGDGAEGIRLAKSIKPDLIFMDIVMPGVNGFQATRQLAKRQLTWLRSMPQRHVIDCLAPDAPDQVAALIALNFPDREKGTAGDAMHESNAKE